MYYLLNYDVFQRTREFYNVCMTKIWNVPTQKSTREFVTLEKKKKTSKFTMSVIKFSNQSQYWQKKSRLYFNWLSKLNKCH